MIDFYEILPHHSDARARRFPRSKYLPFLKRINMGLVSSVGPEANILWSITSQLRRTSGVIRVELGEDITRA